VQGEILQVLFKEERKAFISASEEKQRETEAPQEKVICCEE
jgi:hypothetical protein